MAVHAYTSCSFSYLNRARVLAQTLKKNNPDWILWIVLTDLTPNGFGFDIGKEPFDHVLTLDELYGASSEAWVFCLDIVEACTAVKGRAAQHILSRDNCEKLVYLDPDVAVFNSLSPIEYILDDYSIVLTPHQTDPELAHARISIQDNELASLQYGVFNFGFFAIRDDDEANRFLNWWSARLDEWCHDRLDIGLFVDQKWANLIPCFFDSVKILRDPGYNVASWNLNTRKMLFDEEGRALINGHLLRFYHFTKLGAVGDTMTQRYAKGNTEVYELWWWYREAVAAETSPGIPKGWWRYNAFDNGVKVPKFARELYRQRSDLRTAFRKPFQTGADSFYAWLIANGYKIDGGTSGQGFQPV